MTQTRTYSVPGISCGHCRDAITDEVTAVAGVGSVDVDLDAKLVQISGERLNDSELVAAIDEAGYEVSVPSNILRRFDGTRTGGRATTWLRRAWRYIAARPLT